MIPWIAVPILLFAIMLISVGIVGLYHDDGQDTWISWEVYMVTATLSTMILVIVMTIEVLV